MTDAKRWLDVDVVALVSAQILVDARRSAARPIPPTWLEPGDRWDLAKGQRLRD